jgi:heme iron utilization protein
MSKDTEMHQVQEACRAFPSQFQTLHLGTVSAQGLPEASYAPFVADAGRYYVYLSELARHTANLRCNGRASVLFIESEAQAKQVFARQRLTLACTALEYPRATAPFERVLDRFEQRFGKLMEVIRPLSDFHLFELTPTSGTYVAGFARAYALDGASAPPQRARAPLSRRRQRAPPERTAPHLRPSATSPAHPTGAHPCTPPPFAKRNTPCHRPKP